MVPTIFATRAAAACTASPLPPMILSELLGRPRPSTPSVSVSRVRVIDPMIRSSCAVRSDAVRGDDGIGRTSWPSRWSPRSALTAAAAPSTLSPIVPASETRAPPPPPPLPPAVRETLSAVERLSADELAQLLRALAADGAFLATLHGAVASAARS